MIEYEDMDDIEKIYWENQKMFQLETKNELYIVLYGIIFGILLMWGLFLI